MISEIVNYQSAKWLHLKGFNEATLKKYSLASRELCEITGTIPAPTYAAAFRWIEINYQLFIDRQTVITNEKIQGFTYWINGQQLNYLVGHFTSQYQACLETLELTINFLNHEITTRS